MGAETWATPLISREPNLISLSSVPPSRQPASSSDQVSYEGVRTRTTRAALMAAIRQGPRGDLLGVPGARGRGAIGRAQPGPTEESQREGPSEAGSGSGGKGREGTIRQGITRSTARNGTPGRVSPRERSSSPLHLRGGCVGSLGPSRAPSPHGATPRRPR